MSFHNQQKAFLWHYRNQIIPRALISFLLIIAISCIYTLQQASATVVLSLTLQELVQQADQIVLGECEKMTSAWDDERKRIFTQVTVLTEQCLKGGECPPRIRIRTLGGTVGNIAMNVTGTSRFHEGERVFLFLKGSSGRFYQVLGLSQGKFSILSRGSRSFVRRDMSGLTRAKKRDGKFLFERAEQSEEVDLQTFISTIQFFLREKQ